MTRTIILNCDPTTWADFAAHVRARGINPNATIIDFIRSTAVKARRATPHGSAIIREQQARMDLREEMIKSVLREVGAK